jgi:hypothetical protein
LLQDQSLKKFAEKFGLSLNFPMDAENRVILNIGGTRHETQEREEFYMLATCLDSTFRN